MFFLFFKRTHPNRQTDTHTPNWYSSLKKVSCALNTKTRNHNGDENNKLARMRRVSEENSRLASNVYVTPLNYPGE